MGTHPSTRGSACLYMLVPRAAGEHVPPLLCELCAGSIRTASSMGSSLPSSTGREGWWVLP